MMTDTGLETKFARFGGDVAVTDGTRIEGYASLFDQSDQTGDRVVRGAYAASLAALAGDGRRVKMLWQHDPTRPIGVWDEVREDSRGLWVKGRLLDTTQQGREAAALIEAGALDGLSIGYRTKQAARDDHGNRLLKEVELWEVSLVTFPMLPTARVAAKSDEPVTQPTDDPAAALLRDMAQAFDHARAALAQTDD